MQYLQKVFCDFKAIKVVRYSQFFHPWAPSLQLIAQLSSSKEKSQLSRLLQMEASESEELRVVGLVAALLVHGEDFQSIVQDNMGEKKNPEIWLTTCIINPFKRVILRYCENRGIFSFADFCCIRKQVFMQQLPLLVSLLKEMCVICGEMRKVGRYFLPRENDLSRSCAFFSEAFMLFTNALYKYLKVAVQAYLYELKKSLVELKSVKGVLKWFFGQILPGLNQSFQMMNCDKYFGFEKKGYAIKLLKIEQQSSSVQLLIHEILRDEQKENPQTLEFQIELVPSVGHFDEELLTLAFSSSFPKSLPAEEESESGLALFHKPSGILSTEGQSP